MKIAAVIPARYGSTRFPGKPLALIAGKTMIERVYTRVANSNCFCDVVVATDDDRILNEVHQFGGNAVLTSKIIKTGTERVWNVLRFKDWDAVINIQGDEPLIDIQLLKNIFNMLLCYDADVVTAAFENSSYSDFLSSNAVKVVVDNQFFALYFSRSPIPFVKKGSFDSFFHHIGVYGYSRESIDFFMNSKPSKKEKQENLEQIRFLENGKKIKIVITAKPSLGVDTPEDIARIESIIEDKNG